jgi:large subunit ribosomal protein L17
MRHGKKFNHLGRQTAHRRAMLANMASSLIQHKRINTTVAKAKALKKFVEPLITKSKSDSTHSRRTAFRYLRDKEAVTELFRSIGPAVSTRDGGYTRIIKTGFRAGDAADMCLIELVDFNDIYGLDTKKKKRTRRGGAKKVEGAVAPAAAVVADAAKAKIDEAPEAAAVAEVAEEVVAEVVEEVVAEVVEEVTEVAEETTDAAEEAPAAESEDTTEGEAEADDDKKE